MHKCPCPFSTVLATLAPHGWHTAGAPVADRCRCDAAPAQQSGCYQGIVGKGAETVGCSVQLSGPPVARGCWFTVGRLQKAMIPILACGSKQDWCYKCTAFAAGAMVQVTCQPADSLLHAAADASDVICQHTSINGDSLTTPGSTCTNIQVQNACQMVACSAQWLLPHDTCLHRDCTHSKMCCKPQHLIIVSRKQLLYGLLADNCAGLHWPHVETKTSPERP